MIPGLKRNRSHRIIFWFLILLYPSASHGEGSDFPVGMRGAISFDGGTHRFEQVEAFAGWDMPRRWNFYSDWYFRPTLDVTAGTISNQKAYGFIGTLGPGLQLGKGTFPLIVQGGLSPTILSRYQFDNKDFGSRLQFTTYVSLQWVITKRVSAGLGFQHMSNGGFSKPNPGVNMEFLSTSFCF